MQGITTSNANIKSSNHQSAHIVLANNNSNANGKITASGANIGCSTANGGGPVEHCQGCLGIIHDRYYLQVTDKAWHLQCLRCVECKLSLDSQQTCFAKDGLIYCKEDYFK
jgi:hypothetical protein